DNFDWTTPEPSPRLWQRCPSSPSPSTNYPSSPFPSEMSSTPYPSPYPSSSGGNIHVSASNQSRYPSSSGGSNENIHVCASNQSLLRSGGSNENFHVSASNQSLLLLDQAIDYGSSSPVPMQGYSAPMPMQGYSSPVPMSSPMMMPANNPVVFVQLFQQSPMSYAQEAHRVTPTAGYYNSFRMPTAEPPSESGAIGVAQTQNAEPEDLPGQG
ncbi:unnamed protein product, partial [Polarella glacialis]